MFTILAATLAAAVVTQPQPNPVRPDIEVDPIAFALDGFSLHVGLGKGRYRLDLGVFGLTVPEMIHGQKDFRSSFSGYGAKFDVFLDEDASGPFAGIEGGFATMTVVDLETSLSTNDPAFSGGVRVGWRIELPSDFYLTPWVGVDYRFSQDLKIAGRTYSNSSLTVFPTIHLGHRF